MRVALRVATQFKLGLALEAARKFSEAVRLVDDAMNCIRQRLTWLAAAKAQLEGAPRDKGKGRADETDGADGATAARKPALVPEVPPATAEEAAVEMEDLQGLLESLKDKVCAAAPHIHTRP